MKKYKKPAIKEIVIENENILAGSINGDGGSLNGYVGDGEAAKGINGRIIIDDDEEE